MELSAFLAADAPGGGHDPAALTAAHIQRFAADQRHREREGLASLVMRRAGGEPSIVTTTTRAITFNHARKLLRWALDGRRRRADRAIPAVHHRDAGRWAYPGAQAQPFPRRGRARPGR